MEQEFLEWIRQANGLLMEAYRRRAQECKLCWEFGELRFEALINSAWVLIKAVQLDDLQYLRLFRLAKQMIDSRGHFQIRISEPGNEPAAAYRIIFQVGADAVDCTVRLVLETGFSSVPAEEEAEVKELAEVDDQLDSEYIN